MFLRRGRLIWNPTLVTRVTTKNSNFFSAILPPFQLGRSLGQRPSGGPAPFPPTDASLGLSRRSLWHARSRRKRHPQLKLTGKRFLVIVRLTAVNVKETFEFRFENLGRQNGFLVSA